MVEVPEVVDMVEVVRYIQYQFTATHNPAVLLAYSTNVKFACVPAFPLLSARMAVILHPSYLAARQENSGEQLLDN